MDSPFEENERILPSNEGVSENQMANLTKEELIRSARQTGWADPAGNLLQRYYPMMRKIIGRESRRAGLGRADQEDAEQEAVFAFRHAVDRFDGRSAEHSAFGSFRTFLTVIVTAHVRDFVRRIRRWESHYDRTVRYEDLLEICNDNQWSATSEIDPIFLLTRQEFRAIIDQAITVLDPSARQLWEQLAAGHRLGQVAAALNLSYGQGKRLRRSVLAELANKLRDWAD